jgi:solute carrier family 35, member E1
MAVSMDSSPSSANGTTKFPAFDNEFPPQRHDDLYRRDNWPSSIQHDHSPTLGPGEKPLRTNGRYPGLLNSGPANVGRHKRQKSLTEAIRTIRTRSGSVSQNVQEIADALKAPVSPTLVVRSLSRQTKLS